MTQGSEKRIRDRILTVRLTAEERAAIDEACEQAGLAAGSYARRALLGAPTPREVRRKPADRRELARILGALGKIGSNINQLAAASNAGVLLYAAEVAAAADAVVEMRDAVMQALGREP